MFNDLLSAINNQKEFWRKRKNVSRPNLQVNNISIDGWYNHFKKLLEESYGDSGEDNNDDFILSDNLLEEDLIVLDRPITKEEVLFAINKLKNGKAAGPDKLISEIFKFAQNYIVDFLVKLFNVLFDKGVYPDNWTESIVVPLFKKGNINDVNNYRGISLCDVGSKIYGCIINARLQDWVELKNIT